MRKESVKVGESCTLARKRSEQEHEEERMESTVKEGRFQRGKQGHANKESLSSRSGRKHERVSGRKSSPGQSAESWFHS